MNDASAKLSLNTHICNLKMSATTTTVAEAEQGVATLKLQAQPEKKEEEPYRYAHLLPHFSADRYPPLTPFEHVDPGQRALSHPNPWSFLDGATSLDELTPHLGTEVIGVNLAELDDAGRDQVALEVCHLIPGQVPSPEMGVNIGRQKRPHGLP